MWTYGVSKASVKSNHGHCEGLCMCVNMHECRISVDYTD